MREIKFRAWDKIDSKMINMDELCFIHCGSYNSFLIDILNGLNTDMKLMQYTGLKDKNGIEIYEGDILYSESWWWGNCFVFPYQDRNKLTYVLAKNIKNPNEHITWNIWDGNDVKIIGNIYETPELLK